MSYILSWAKGIFALCLITEFFVSFIVSDKYTKYLRFICGIFVISLCVLPILNIFNKNISYNKIYKYFVDSTQISELKENVKTFKNENSEKIIVETYKNEIIKQLETNVFNAGFVTSKCEVDIYDDSTMDSYGKIKSIYMQIGKDSHSNEKIINAIEPVIINENKNTKYSSDITDLRNEISDEYGIPLSAVKIIIK